MDQPMIDTKSLFAPKKGKEATKGQKQIYNENKSTIKMYSAVAILPFLARIIVAAIMTNPPNIFLTVFVMVVQACSVGGLYFMAKPVTAGASKTIVDGGIDLNLGGGFAEYLKDIIMTTAFCNFVSSFSDWIYLIWLWLPACWALKIWTSVIAPWIFAPAPEAEKPEVADKKRRKMERKMARAGYR